MLNRVVLVGRLTKDPELRYTPSGVAVANFTLAVNRPFTNQQGDREADFINVVVWRRQAENAANFLKKGNLAGVDGRVQTRSYDNSQGQRVFVTEVMAESVQFLEPKGSNNSGSSSGGAYGGSAGGSSGGASSGSANNNRNSNKNNQNNDHSNFGDDPFASDGKPIDISDDDLPF